MSHPQTKKKAVATTAPSKKPKKAKEEETEEEEGVEADETPPKQTTMKGRVASVAKPSAAPTKRKASSKVGTGTSK